MGQQVVAFFAEDRALVLEGHGAVISIQNSYSLFHGLLVVYLPT